MRLRIIFLFTVVIACKFSDHSKTETGSNQYPCIIPDTSLIPDDSYGESVKYGRALMLNTAYFIGPKGINGQYTANCMNCTNCHQDAGTKPFSLSLMRSHQRYPSYRPREDKVLSLSERINNCVMRPHSGKPLPHDSKEMVAIMAYLRWINSFAAKHDSILGEQSLKIIFPERAASPIEGEKLYKKHCARCHGSSGEGKLASDNTSFQYPPLWGPQGYQPGSSMHRVVLQARWLKANMPYDLAKYDKPVLTDEEALDIAAFVNDDRIHERPNPKTFDYPNPNTKPMDYGKGPYKDTFPETQHKFGPYNPIIHYWEINQMKLVGK